jgi:diguanylate cyclase (GGDEF)-like protein
MMPRHILLVDDDEAVCSLIQRALDAFPYRFSRAADGEQAIHISKTDPPDLVVLDIQMPGINGHEVLKDLRRNIRTQMVPVIILSGHGALPEKLAGFQLGADDYMTKPFHVEELTVRVQTLLYRSRRDLSANPLTRLPGSPAIEEEVTRRFLDHRAFAFFYMDIDHFKAFNDVYGYPQGDRVIQNTADLLVESLRLLPASDGFLGHVGGDDFVALARPEAAQALAQGIVNRFDRMVPAFYREEDRSRGCVVTRNRQGREQRFPLMTLTVAVTASERHDRYAKVAETAREIKQYLKSLPGRQGSAYLFDRRKDRVADIPAEARAGKR